MFGPLAHETVPDLLIQVFGNDGFDGIPQQLEGRFPAIPVTFNVAKCFLPFCQQLFFQPLGNLLCDPESFLDALVLRLRDERVSGFGNPCSPARLGLSPWTCLLYTSPSPRD